MNAPSSTFQRYVEEMDARCPRDDSDSSTGGMVQSELDYAHCQAAFIDTTMRALPERARAVLLDGDAESERGRTVEPTGSLWARSNEAAARVEDAQDWVHGGMRLAGTMAYNFRAARLVERDAQLGFIAHAWSEGKPLAVVEHVAAREHARKDPRPRMKAWRRYAQRARASAPFAALPNAELHTRLPDASWIELERDLDTSEAGCGQLAKSLCTEWSALRAAFGDASSCEARMATSCLPSNVGVMEDGEPTDPAPDQQLEPADESSPPPADAAFAAALLAHRQRCELGAEHSCARALLDAARADPALHAREALTRLFGTLADFQRSLCAADAAARFVSFSEDTQAWSAPLAEADPCMATAQLLTGYWLEVIARADATALTAHVRARSAWGSAVSRGLDQVAAQFEAACTPSSACEPSAGPARARVAAMARGLTRKAATLAERACKAEPFLPLALGPPTCETALTAYFLSSARHLGALDP